MLIRFSFANFKSFKNENCLDMEATSLKEHDYNVFKTSNGDFLKVSAIYGANASGKTNVLEAFYYMKKKVLISDDSKINLLGNDEDVYTFMIKRFWLKIIKFINMVLKLLMILLFQNGCMKKKSINFIQFLIGKIMILI